jgi:myosin-7
VREAEATKTPAQWAKEIFDAHKDVGTGKSDIEVCLVSLCGCSFTSCQAKVKYLSAVKQFPLYGGSSFEVEYKGFWSFPNKSV